MLLSEVNCPCRLIFLGEVASSYLSVERYGFKINCEFEVKKIISNTFIVKVNNSMYAMNASMAKLIKVGECLWQ